MSRRVWWLAAAVVAGSIFVQCVMMMTQTVEAHVGSISVYQYGQEYGWLIVATASVGDALEYQLQPWGVLFYAVPTALNGTAFYLLCVVSRQKVDTPGGGEGDGA